MQRALGIASPNCREGAEQIPKRLYRKAPSLRGLKPPNDWKDCRACRLKFGETADLKSALLRCARSLNRYAWPDHRVQGGQALATARTGGSLKMSCWLGMGGVKVRNAPHSILAQSV